jgi:hypothetical protein
MSERMPPIPRLASDNLWPYDLLINLSLAQNLSLRQPGRIRVPDLES